MCLAIPVGNPGDARPAIVIGSMNIVWMTVVEDSEIWVQRTLLFIAICWICNALGGALFSLYRMAKISDDDPGSGAAEFFDTILGFTAATKKAQELVESSVKIHGEDALEQVKSAKQTSESTDG